MMKEREEREKRKRRRRGEGREKGEGREGGVEGEGLGPSKHTGQPMREEEKDSKERAWAQANLVESQ